MRLQLDETLPVNELAGLMNPLGYKAMWRLRLNGMLLAPGFMPTINTNISTVIFKGRPINVCYALI